MASQFVRFEYGAEDRMGPDQGPFEYVQLTYEALRASKTDDDTCDHELAAFSGGWWITADGQRWSDVVFFSANPPS